MSYYVTRTSFVLVILLPQSPEYVGVTGPGSVSDLWLFCFALFPAELASFTSLVSLSSHATLLVAKWVRSNADTVPCRHSMAPSTVLSLCCNSEQFGFWRSAFWAQKCFSAAPVVWRVRQLTWLSSGFLPAGSSSSRNTAEWVGLIVRNQDAVSQNSSSTRASMCLNAHGQSEDNPWESFPSSM